MSNPSSIVIVGAGISGMTTALALGDLCRARGSDGPAITVLEAEAYAGGKIRTDHDGGYTCEWGVNGFLNKEPKTIELCRRLDLMDALLPASTAFKNRYIYRRGKLRKVSMHPVKFMLSGLLPLSAKLRLLKEPWIKRRVDDGTDDALSSDESVASFARRRIGDGAFRILVDPMQTGIYAGDPEQMSVRSAFPRVVEVEQQYGSLIRGLAKLSKQRAQAGEAPAEAGPRGHLTTFHGGMQTLIDRLAQALGPQVLRVSTPVEGIARNASGYRVRLAGGGESLEADAVILACPAHVTARLLDHLDSELSQATQSIPYAPLAVVCLGYDKAQMVHPMDGFGFLAPRGEGLRILGALWTSSMFPGRAPDGHCLVSAMIGGARDPDVLSQSDEELMAVVSAEIAKVQGVTGAPAFVRVFRHERAIPQYTIGHTKRLAVIEARLPQHPGLFITGNAYQGVGVNDCARNAAPLAERVIAASAR